MRYRLGTRPRRVRCRPCSGPAGSSGRDRSDRWYPSRPPVCPSSSRVVGPANPSSRTSGMPRPQSGRGIVVSGPRRRRPVGPANARTGRHPLARCAVSTRTGLTVTARFGPTSVAFRQRRGGHGSGRGGTSRERPRGPPQHPVMTPRRNSGDSRPSAALRDVEPLAFVARRTPTALHAKTVCVAHVNV